MREQGAHAHRSKYQCHDRNHAIDHVHVGPIRKEPIFGELPAQTHDYSVYKDPGNIGTFKFVMIRKLLAPESDVEPSERTAITLKYIIRRAAGTPARWYGLENSNVSFEYVPLFTKFKAVSKMQRLAPNERP